MPITGGVGTGKKFLGEIESFPHIAREYKEKGLEMDHHGGSKLWRRK